MNFVGGYADEWWKLRNRLDRALKKASGRLDPEGRRSVALGSPVLVGRANGDVTRVPVILRGGQRELPVAYVVIEQTRVDSGRIERLAQQMESLARAVIAGASPTTGKDLEVTYP